MHSTIIVGAANLAARKKATVSRCLNYIDAKNMVYSQEIDFVYLAGYKDCVALLKELGVK